MSSGILVLDFGSQFTQLIARHVREQGVYAEVHPWFSITREQKGENAPGLPTGKKWRGIILSGSHLSATDGTIPPSLLTQLLTYQIPILGICFGMQLMAAHLGGQVKAVSKREFGYAQTRARGHTPLLLDINDHTTPEGYGMLEVWMSHGDQVTMLPPGFRLMASTDSCPIAGMAMVEKNLYGLQFHPEVSHTRQGTAILKRFVQNICGAPMEWNMHNYIPQSVESLRTQVGQDAVILGLSGGVDSTVAAALLQRAIGHQLHCVFVDHGLLRKNEREQVIHTLTTGLDVQIHTVDASKTFLSALKGVSDPEQKRKIIGREFVNVFEAEAHKITGARWLAQGTIYPDVIESAGTNSQAHTIKSHHNVGGLPEQMNLKILEPLRQLFKDEVRVLGETLGLPHDLVWRHPFPGPGLGIRILGEIQAQWIPLLQEADAIFIEELRNTKDTEGVPWYARLAQAFAVFLPVRSVGVMGDGRTYEHVIALRAVHSNDFMTAQWATLPHELLGTVSRRIINEVPGINRVVYDISSKPPATIEWE